MKIEVFGVTWISTCKTRVKVIILMKTWNDPTVITVILPQPVSRKTPIEVQFLTKVLKRIFPKVWNSVWGLYSTIWRNSCGNFDEKSIRTRLKRSRQHRKPKKTWIYNIYMYVYQQTPDQPQRGDLLIIIHVLFWPGDDLRPQTPQLVGLASSLPDTHKSIRQC